MIYIKSIRNVKYDDHDEVWAIVRKWKDRDNANIKHVPELSPSCQLLNEYLNARDNGNFGERYFQTSYVPTFINEIFNNKNARTRLNELVKLDKAGKNICLVCFCQDESLCHRSIIAGLLMGCGCNVMTELPDQSIAKHEYIKYYHYYRQLDCPLRHENGNCVAHGGFCLAVDDNTCRALKEAYKQGLRDNTARVKKLISKLNEQKAYMGENFLDLLE